MTDEQMDAYKMRITQAGVGELAVVMLEMEMQWIDEALKAHEEKDLDTFVNYVGKAQSVQVELMTILNMENEVAVEVYSVYAFINKQLIESKIKRQPQDLDRCRNLLEKYHKSFQQIAATDTAGPIMEASEKVYAGLTYGTGGLVENSVGGTEYSV